MADSDSGYGNWYRTGFAASDIVLGLASDNRLTRFLGNRYFVYLGLISYALYLIQASPLIVWWLIAWLPSSVQRLPDLGVVYIIATLPAMICYEFIERPARGFILRRFSRQRETTLAPVPS